MIVNAIIVYAMRSTNDIHRVKKEVVQAFLFQFGLHIIVLLRPQVWGFLTAFNKVNLLCSFGLAAAYGYLLMGKDKKISNNFATADKLAHSAKKLETLVAEQGKSQKTIKGLESQVEMLTKQNQA